MWGIYILSNSNAFQYEILSKSLEIEKTTLAKLNGMDISSYPIIADGSILNEKNASDIRHLFNDIIKKKNNLILLPPFHIADIGQFLPNNPSIKISQCNSETVIFTNNKLKYFIGVESAEILFTHCIETWQGYVLAKTQTGNKLLVVYRPSNVSGSILITTLQLGVFSARTDENIRRKLLNYIVDACKVKKRKKENNTIISPIPSALLLVLYVLCKYKKTVDFENIKKVASDLKMQISDITLPSLLDSLNAKGIIQNESINKEALNAEITKQRLWPYVRRVHRNSI